MPTHPSRPAARPAELRLAERYGQPSRAGHWFTVAVSVLFATLGLSWVVWASIGQSESVHGEVLTFSVRSAHRIDIQVEVVSSNKDGVSCQVHAEASDHATVGQAIVNFAAGSSGTRASIVSVRTSRRAVTGILDSCAPS